MPLPCCQTSDIFLQDYCSTAIFSVICLIDQHIILVYLLKVKLPRLSTSLIQASTTKGLLVLWSFTRVVKSTPNTAMHKLQLTH